VARSGLTAAQRAFLEEKRFAVVGSKNPDGSPHLAVMWYLLDGDDIVYICRSAETRIISINLLVGTRLPAYCTSMGQVLLAELAPEAMEAYLDRVRLIARTDRTITTTQKLRKLLKGVHEDGHALLDQELEVGLRSIAVPVRDARGAVVAAMNVSTHASRVSLEEMQSRFLPVLERGARSLGTVLLS